MSLNQKLTHVIQGRTVSSIVSQDSKLHVTFGDGSMMTIKPGVTAEPVPSAMGEIAHVRQEVAPPVLHFDYKDGSTWSTPLAEATSCVMLRNAQGKLEYVD
jgi:hypothetical protein